jgi:hypothetical protein
VWYDEAFDSYRVCSGDGEDPSCSNSLWLKWGVSDHIYYFGVRVGDDCATTLAAIDLLFSLPFNSSEKSVRRAIKSEIV